LLHPLRVLGAPDPYQLVEGADGTAVRLLTEELRSRAEALVGKAYQLDLSRPRFSFLLGSEANDEAARVVSK